MVGIDGPVALPSTCGIRRLRLNLGTPGSWVNCYLSGSNNFNCKDLTVLSIWRLHILLVLISTMGRLGECVNPQCDFWCEDPGMRIKLIIHFSWRYGFGIRSTRRRRGGSYLNAFWMFLDNVNLPNLAKVAFLVHVLLLGLLNYHRAPRVFWTLQAFFTLHMWRFFSFHYAKCQLIWFRWWVWNCLEKLELFNFANVVFYRVWRKRRFLFCKSSWRPTSCNDMRFFEMEKSRHAGIGFKHTGGFFDWMRPMLASLSCWWALHLEAPFLWLGPSMEETRLLGFGLPPRVYCRVCLLLGLLVGAIVFVVSSRFFWYYFDVWLELL
ncbi:hypothetical protein L1887_06946 [Cichorium endivia]|nr:hypothetical protein L1887_06946 [Cichorium endivia]